MNPFIKNSKLPSNSYLYHQASDRSIPLYTFDIDPICELKYEKKNERLCINLQKKIKKWYILIY